MFLSYRSPITFILALKSLTLYPINHISIPIQIAAHVLAYSNVCLNPFIYAAAHPGFRNSFKALLCCGRLGTNNLRASAHLGDYERTDAAGESANFGLQRTRSRRGSGAAGLSRHKALATSSNNNNNNNNSSTTAAAPSHSEHIPLTSLDSAHTHDDADKDNSLLHNTDNGLPDHRQYINGATSRPNPARQSSIDSVF